MTTPKVSIIMPVYNGEQYVAEAIESVLAQSFGDWELLILDDGSTDHSSAIVAAFQDDRIRTFTRENSGVSVTRNHGIAQSRGALIAFLDQDDRWTADALNMQVSYHDQHPDVKYTLAQQVCFLDEETTMPTWFQLQKLDVPHVGYLPGTLVVKHGLFDTLGVFDTAYPISSDADWFARAKDAAIATAILPDLILERRIHAENQSRLSATIQRELFQLLQASIRRKKQAKNA